MLLIRERQPPLDCRLQRTIAGRGRKIVCCAHTAREAPALAEPCFFLCCAAQLNGTELPLGSPLARRGAAANSTMAAGIRHDHHYGSASEQPAAAA